MHMETQEKHNDIRLDPYRDVKRTHMLKKISRLSLHVYNCNQIHDVKHIGLNMKYPGKRKKKRKIKEIN